MCLVIVSIVEKKNWFYSVIFSLFQTLPTNGSRFQHATWWSKGMGLWWRYLFYFLSAWFVFQFLYFCSSVRLYFCLPAVLCVYLMLVILKNGPLVFGFFACSEGALMIRKWRKHNFLLKLSFLKYWIESAHNCSKSNVLDVF